MNRFTPLRAYQDAEGNWFLNGVKRFITNGCGEVLLVLGAGPGVGTAGAVGAGGVAGAGGVIGAAGAGAGAGANNQLERLPVNDHDAATVPPATR